jgi:hypothetical protein
MAQLKDGETFYTGDNSNPITGYVDCVAGGDITIDNNLITTGLQDTSKWNITAASHDFYFPGRYNGTPFEAAFPLFDQVQEMCKEYPGLERAYENFKTAYALVEQDWKGKQSDK